MSLNPLISQTRRLKRHRRLRGGITPESENQQELPRNYNPRQLCSALTNTSKLLDGSDGTGN